MKDRVREAMFNLLGPAVEGKHALDLFAGTGALGLEALSRGARRATFIEQHGPTAAVLRENVAQLEVAQQCEVVTGNVFLWYRRGPDLGTDPWLVFCSPPYDFYVTRPAEMRALLTGLIDGAPPQSLFAVESDDRFDFGQLPDAGAWDVRVYAPAVVGVYCRRASGA
jgi:16S rRNA (guanine966-N2)-methyltransferase